MYRQEPVVFSNRFPAHHALNRVRSLLSAGKSSLIVLLAGLAAWFSTPSLHSQSADIDLLRAIYTPTSTHADPYFRAMSDSYLPVAICLPVSLGITGLLRQDNRLVSQAIELGLATGLSGGLALAGKHLFNRPRPFITYSDITAKIPAGGPSFPSGHASLAFALATSVSLNFPKWYFILPAYAWAGHVAYSRLYLGVHYPSDVLAGCLLGIGSAWLTHLVNNRLHRAAATPPLPVIP
jgi:hypothetical protein